MMKHASTVIRLVLTAVMLYMVSTEQPFWTTLVIVFLTISNELSAWSRRLMIRAMTAGEYRCR